MRYVLILLSFLLCQASEAQLRVSGMFSDHMVLQREMEVPVWGWGTPGAEVVVAFGENRVSTKITGDGEWMVRLSPLDASSVAIKLIISSGSESMSFANVLVGDVWFASGQSNMNWKVKNSNDPESEIAAANYPLIRLYQVPNKVSQTPNEDLDGEWTVCSPNSIPDFSAVAYFFGRELHQTENVPIGLVHSSWGGTPSEAWTSLEMLESHADFSDGVREIQSSDEDFQQLHELQQSNMRALRQRVTEVEKADARQYAEAQYDDTSWPTMEVPVHYHNTEIAGFQGIAWMRKYFTLSKSQSKSDLQLILGKIEQGDRTYVNGEFVGETYKTHELRSYEVPSKYLKEGKNVVAIRVKHMRNAGGGIYEGPLQVLQGENVVQDLAGEWQYNHRLEHDFPLH